MSKYMQKTAAAVLITVGVSFGFFLSSNEVRSSCFDTLIKVYSKFVDINVGNNASDGLTLNILYVPAGYKEIGHMQNGDNIMNEYKNDQGQTITLRCTRNFSNLQMDNEHYIIKNEDLSIENGTLLIARNDEYPNLLYWSTDTYYFTLKAFLAEDELIKIAKNVEISVSN